MLISSSAAFKAALVALAITLGLCLIIDACAAQEGRHGIGHARWHEQFYSKLIRKDTRTSCCSLADCVPTQSRRGDDGRYEVLVDGEWTPVPQNTIQNVTAPDHGAHVCFPKQPSQYYPRGTLFCVVLPPES